MLIARLAYWRVTPSRGFGLATTISMNASSRERDEVAELERELNALVYQVYGLTEEEIKIVEEATS